jgi:hypothetical protein
MIRHLPARLLSPDERALVAEWFATTGDLASAYVSSRHGDDPALRHRIMVVAKPNEGPSHIIYASAGRDVWVVVASGRRTRIRRFRSLHAALNSIRPVLAVEAEQVASRLKPA